MYVILITKNLTYMLVVNRVKLYECTMLLLLYTNYRHNFIIGFKFVNYYSINYLYQLVSIGHIYSYFNLLLKEFSTLRNLRIESLNVNRLIRKDTLSQTQKYIANQSANG